MTNTTNTIHTPGTAVAGTYCGVPFSGIVTESRQHSYNAARFEVTCEVDAASVARIRAEGYGAGPTVIVAVAYDGSPAYGECDTLRPAD